jgi:outer membrane protein
MSRSPATSIRSCLRSRARMILTRGITSSLLFAAAPHALAPPLAAQQVAGTLTLEDALLLARDHNPAFQRVRNDVVVAANAVRTAWAAAFLPNMSSSIGFGGSRYTSVTGQDAFGHPARLPDPRSSRSSSASQGVGSQITLFDGLGSIRGLQAQRALFAGTEAHIEAQELLLLAQVSREYFQAVKATRVIALEEALLASARERLLRTEELLRIAARNRVDVLGARADVAQSEQNLERARGEADKARLNLASTIGIEPTTSMTLDTALPRIFSPADLDAEALVGHALRSSPLIQQREAALSAARHRADAARGRRLPTLSASAGYNRSVTQSGYGAFGELNPLNYGFSFGLQASLPIFTRFQTSAAIGEAAAAHEDAEHDLRGARLTVERDVRAALIDLENAHRSLMLAEQNAELSRERQDLTQEQYRLGGVNFTELQNVIDRTAQAERQALDARFQFIIARLNLEEKLGTRLED